MMTKSDHGMLSRTIGIAACIVLLLLGFAAQADETADFIQQWHVGKPWTGDFDEMADRRTIRVLVVHNKMMFFFDKAHIRGVTNDAFREFETYINKKLKTGTRKIRVVFMPVTRDKLLPWLIEGRGDIAAANLTITGERLQLVDFSRPVLTDVSEIIITGPTGPKLDDLRSLSGQQIHVRHSSSYFEHLTHLNHAMASWGLAPIRIVAASEHLEDSDLLEMVNAGLIPMVAVDRHKAEFWVRIFDQITLHPDITINTGGEIAWAMRKNSPQLKALTDEFIRKHGKGRLLGNILFKRYLVNNTWARNALSPKEQQKFDKLVGLFKKYSDLYDFDYLMMAALAYQESHLDHSQRSHVGAVGIMQILPSTAADKNVGIPDIEDLENNIHAGVKYLRFLRDRYFSDPAIDALNQTLFAFAAYNAGPAKVRRYRNETRKIGLDPNVWFGNVEVVVARRIGRETVQYVSNIYKYYIAYRLTYLEHQATTRHATSE